jgi:hypothetical protein
MMSTKLIDTGWPLIELGYGKIEVADGTCRQTGKPALIFGRNGTGKIGEPTPPERIHEPGETLAVITFENVESLDVLLGELAEIRARLTAETLPAKHNLCRCGRCPPESIGDDPPELF